MHKDKARNNKVDARILHVPFFVRFHLTRNWMDLVEFLKQIIPIVRHTSEKTVSQISPSNFSTKLNYQFFFTST